MRNNKGFTLIEMLVVMVIIGVLATMMVVGMDVARKKARITKAHAECKQLVQAWKAYWLVYGSWPAVLSGKTNAPMDSSAMKLLMGDNPKKLNFFEVNDKIAVDGFKDPWDNMYIVDFSPAGKVEVDEAYQTTVFLPNRKRYLYDDLPE